MTTALDTQDHTAGIDRMEQLRTLAAQQERRERERDLAYREEQRLAAPVHAHEFITGTFPNTLAKLLNLAHWRGYAPIEFGVASAVAHLGEGVWLHHARPNGGRGVLTLIAPCPCGHGYREKHVEGDTELLYAIADISTWRPPVFSCTPGGSACTHAECRPNDGTNIPD